MVKRLKDNLSSKYFEAGNRMTSRTARRRIVAYVESYDDIFFWRTILSSFENSTRYFQVMLPSKVHQLERGKKAVLMRLLSHNVGKDMIACVDADYDYLLQGATQMSKEVCTNPYIFHTYSYAIENLQCFAPGLHDITVAVTLNDHAIFDFEAFFRQYSEAIFPLFVWNIWYYRSTHYGDFTITDFNRTITIGHVNLQNPEAAIDHLRHRVGQKIKQLQALNPTAKAGYQQVKDDIKRLGVTPQTTYLYIQGHHLFDSLSTPLLGRVCDRLIREREHEIYSQAKHTVQLHNELSSYKHSLEDIASMLKRGMGFLNSSQVKSIRSDLEKYLDVS